MNVRILPMAAIRACPHVILIPEHYRDDNTCRCDDPAHQEMAAWGYVWSGLRWTAPTDWQDDYEQERLAHEEP